VKKKDLLSVADFTADEVGGLLEQSLLIKRRKKSPVLEERTLALLFEKASLRTRVSFEMAMCQMKGKALYLSPEEVGLGRREPASDVARVLSRYVDCIAARTFSHETLRLLAENASVPVINALSDVEHPCQAFTDIFTIYEQRGDLSGLTLAYIGDGNNVANSLLLAAAKVGINFRIASPPGYEVAQEVLRLGEKFAAASGGSILQTDDPQQAVKDADVVYTDVWVSMGQEAERDKRRRDFVSYQVDRDLLSLAGRDALFMHPLPAHRGEEVSENVIEDTRSVVFEQAENRLHVQKALLAKILGKGE
jgi:ornithine carbamoyltransferase